MFPFRLGPPENVDIIIWIRLVNERTLPNAGAFSHHCIEH